MRRRPSREKRGLLITALCVGAPAAIVSALLVALGAVIGCMSTAAMAPPVGPELLSVAGSHRTSAAKLKRGRRIYLTQCARCHSVEPIGKYSAAQWRDLLPGMVEESKLEADEAADLEAYVMTARASWPVR